MVLAFSVLSVWNSFSSCSLSKKYLFYHLRYKPSLQVSGVPALLADTSVFSLNFTPEVLDTN